MEKQVVQCLEPEQKVHSKANLTGIPTQMKQDFEDRCGVSLDDVRVHYHSDMPAKLGALAYTRGSRYTSAQGRSTACGMSWVMWCSKRPWRSR